MPHHRRGRRAGTVQRPVGGTGAPPTRMGVLHSRQVTTLPRSWSSTSMNLRHFGLGHCTANTPPGAEGVGDMTVSSYVRRPRLTYEARVAPERLACSFVGLAVAGGLLLLRLLVREEVAVRGVA